MADNPVNRLSSSEQLILELVNKERLAAGLEPVAVAPQINAAAQKHSEWMAAGRRLDHTGSGGSSPWDRMKAEGWNEYPMGENIAYNPFNQSQPAAGEYVPQKIVQDMHTGWMNSTGHRANILNANFTIMGVGDAIGGHPSAPNHSTSYATQNFAGTTKNYVTGVVYDDADDDTFYDMGEGLGSANVTIVNASGTTVATQATDPGGGYSIALADGSYTAKFTGNGIDGTIEKSFSISGKNVKVDVKDGSAGDGTPTPPTPPTTPVGTNGDDVIRYTNGDDFWSNGAPRDIGRAGTDTLIINEGSVFNTAGLSWYGFERFQGAEKNDRVVGNDANVSYYLDGGGGNDTLKGNAGNDTLIGGNGNDSLHGRAGNDTIKGGAGRDEVSGGAGDDVVYYGSGDVFWDNGVPRDIGGSGIDTLIVEAGSKFNTAGLSWYGFERFQGAEKDDRVVGNDATVSYNLKGGAGDDILRGNAGNDTIVGGAGRDDVSGGAGNDVIYFGSGDVYWDNGVPRDIGGSGIDTLVVEAGSYFNTSALSRYGFERFRGAERDDRVVGDDGKVSYRLDGGAGNDTLKSNSGDDTLIGGAGNDILEPGASSGGQQNLSGGTGNDTYVLTSAAGNVSITETANAGNDQLIFRDLKRSDVDASLDSANNMVLSWDNGDSQVSINDRGAHVERFEFSDGAVFQSDDFSLV